MIYSRVRITHRPTGRVVEVTGERSLVRARNAGLSVLRSLLAHGDAPRRPVRTYRSDTPDVPLADSEAAAEFERMVYDRLRTMHRRSGAVAADGTGAVGE